MQKRLFFKLAMIGGLVLLLLIPLALIEDVIDERQRYRFEARASVQQSWTGAQEVIGPILVVPYEEQIILKTWDANKKAYTVIENTVDRVLLISPKKLSVDGDIDSEVRQRGIYGVPVYTGTLGITGQFTNQALLDFKKTITNRVTWKQPYLTLLVSDLRGVITQPSVQWQSKTLSFKSGTGINGLETGMHALLDSIDLTELADYSFSMNLNLRGMERISFAPLGDDTLVKLHSTWPHPSFTGRYLPSKHEISEEGFTASWQASSFSSDIASDLTRCTYGECDPLVSNTFGVSFIQSVDAYVQSERSIKYGILFLSLTFILFFLYEVMRRMAVHPVQYLLVGLAMSVFFLLLISLSEVIPFAAAYALSALACTGLLGSYVGGMLKSARTGGVFAGMLSVLYATLFVIISSEDSALLMGSMLIFLVLSAVMLITRKLDWYNIGERLSSQAHKPKPAPATVAQGESGI